MKIYTIGFTGKSAREFFTKLRDAGVKNVIDVRLWPSTQLSGFSKSRDLAFFLSALCRIGYEHRKDLAPSEDILKNYKEGKISWVDYEMHYRALLKNRKIIWADEMSDGCLLCAEPTAEKCHRRLLAEFFKEQNLDLDIIHL